MNFDQALIKEINNTFEYNDGLIYWKISRSNKIKAGSIAGHKDKKRGYISINFDGKRMYSHQIIFLMFHGYLPKEVDHIDNNQLNNKIENLRASVRSENGSNRGLQKNNKSGAKGVSRYKDTGLWRVRVKVNKKEKHIGYFEDLELAELVAIEARNKYHGEFARHK